MDWWAPTAFGAGSSRWRVVLKARVVGATAAALLLAAALALVIPPTASATEVQLQAVAPFHDVDYRVEPVPDFPVTVRLLVLNYDPLVPSRGNAPLHTVCASWQDPHELVTGYVAALNSASGGTIHYQVDEWRDIDGFWRFMDGYRYTVDEYVGIYDDYVASNGGESGGYWESPLWHTGVADYASILSENSVIPAMNSERFDEVLLLGPPMCGYYESLMVGPNPIWCNAPPLVDSSAYSNFVVMTVGWERELGCALEDFCHRTESILSYVFASTSHEGTGRNYWLEFIRYDLVAPGQAAVGNCHFAPNSESDYDWGNTRYVQSTCDDWLNFPNLTGAKKSVNCTEWGSGDQAAHHIWWLSHIPNAHGVDADGMLYNWWGYISIFPPPQPARTDELLLYRTTNGTRLAMDLGMAGGTKVLGKVTWSTGFTNVIPLELDGDARSELVVYNKDTGKRVFLDLSSSGSPSVLSVGYWSKNWSQIVPVEVDGDEASELLFYRSSDGAYLIMNVSKTGGLTRLGSGRWSTGFTHVAALELDGDIRSEIVVYNQNNGKRVFLHLYSSGYMAVASVGYWSKDWSQVVPVEIDGDTASELLLYRSSDGTRLVCNLSGTGGVSRMNSGAWSSGWTHAIALESDGYERCEVLLYNQGTGKRALVNLSAGGYPTVMSTGSWTTGWSHILPIEVDGS